MKRFPDWPERLNAYIEGRRERPFCWGSNDCALFAADAVEAITGETLGKAWRKYKTAKGAAQIIKRAGGMRGLAEKAGLVEKPVGLAQRGDVVLVAVEGRETFGIVAGNGHWCGPGEHRLVFRPLSEIAAAFAV